MAEAPGGDRVPVGRSLTGVGYALVFVYAVRMAGMYAITTTTLLLHAGCCRGGSRCSATSWPP